MTGNVFTKCGLKKEGMNIFEHRMQTRPENTRTTPFSVTSLESCGGGETPPLETTLSVTWQT